MYDEVIKKCDFQYLLMCDIYNNRDFVESMKSVKNAGMNAIEFWAWWNKNLEAIKKVKKETELEIAAFFTKSVSLADETKRNEYIIGLKELKKQTLPRSIFTPEYSVKDFRQYIKRVFEFLRMMEGK